jgi:hypothetical protein
MGLDCQPNLSEAERDFPKMFSRLFQTTKAFSYAVTLALLLQPSVLGCALGCASVTRALSQHECHASNLSPDNSEASASISAEHACCHSLKSTQHESVSQELVKMSAMMPCCVAGQPSVPAVKQRAVTDKANTNLNEKAATCLAVEFRATTFTLQARLPDRGGTYLRCCTLLV